ncbi:MAG: NAD(P)/FAD-dependent oxidoreductase [Anaerolineales bacterium]|nr:NAD(P)/FAD-dependent oxidoreductase [Anaerolineales bacterium]MCB9128319.1 NAD(P)/FAD-dependent oxidoreductase [Ardenticatenales bacterium]MCB9172131.1 NAD(P)/FAD-dependent oxidoreductase [Ardenticatenales bacterium]
MHHKVVIVGGGAAGITVAAQLRRGQPDLDVAIIEPSEKHYYQPLWTLVGAGVFPKETTMRDESSLIPAGVTWIKDAVTTFDPDNNTLMTQSGDGISYDYLVVAPGIQIDWDGIPGLAESVGKPGSGVVSNYSYDTVESTWEAIRNFKGGTAIFTQPATPIKCGGAPQKILYLADDAFRKQGVRNKTRMIFASASGAIFSVPKYAQALDKVIDRKGIETMYLHNLVELKPESKEAVFAHMNTGERVTLKYDMIHVTPPQSAPDFVKHSPLANADGWVDVDQYTMRHNRYPNVYALGDASSVPTSKTGAAIRKQAPTAAYNLLADLTGSGEEHQYKGYTSCPLVTGYGSLILAEFDWDGPAESFPFDQSEERYSMYLLKKYGLPAMYWNAMLKGVA